MSKSDEKKGDKFSIDFAQRVPGKKCEKCSRIHTHVEYIPHSFAKHYCTEHWPGSKNDWRHPKLREHYLKAMEELSTVEPDYKKMSSYEKCMTYMKLKGFG